MSFMSNNIVNSTFGGVCIINGVNYSQPRKGPCKLTITLEHLESGEKKQYEELYRTAPKTYSVEIHGNAKNVSTTLGNIVVKGQVNGPVKSSSGDIDVANAVHGNVNSTSGDITTQGNIGGNVNTTSGGVRSNGSIHGSVSTVSGSIR